ncbi:MAG: chemotaxis protein CheW [Candidatus Glassbacteria bacterium]|nr:chemotaxis protein CheW [Candidatus Glassbacteria bacterium]
MNKTDRLVVFHLDDQRYALYLHAVQRIIRTVEITPLPEVSGIISGLINIRGRIVPVFNVRKRFNLSVRDTNLNDRIIIAQTKKWAVALVADRVQGVIEPTEGQQIPSEMITPGMELFDGVIKLEDGIILIHDLERFLSLEEEKILSQAIEQGKESKHD